MKNDGINYLQLRIKNLFQWSFVQTKMRLNSFLILKSIFGIFTSLIIVDTNSLWSYTQALHSSWSWRSLKLLHVRKKSQQIKERRLSHGDSALRITNISRDAQVRMNLLMTDSCQSWCWGYQVCLLTVVEDHLNPPTSQDPTNKVTLIFNWTLFTYLFQLMKSESLKSV